MKPIILRTIFSLMLLLPVSYSSYAACNAPQIINIANVYTTSADLFWPQNLNAIAYQVSVTPTATPNSATATTVTIPQLQLTGLTCDVKYYVNVRTVCGANDTSAWTLDSLTTIKCCNPPTPFSFTQQGFTAMKVDMTGQGNAISYAYNVSTSPGTPQMGTNTPNTTILLQGLQLGTTYYYCARTYCGSNSEPLSVWSCDTFSLQPLCKPVDTVRAILAPGGQVILSWTADVYATGYEYSVSTNPTPPASGTPTTNTQAIVSNLTPGELYNVCVRVMCAPNNSPTAWTCDTARVPTSVSGVRTAVDNIHLYPNPAKGQLNIEVANVMNGGVLQLTDLLGKIVLQQQISQSKTSIDIRHLSGGIYFARYADALGKVTRTVVVD